MKFEIKNRWTGDIAFTLEGETFKLAIEAAIKAGVVFKAALFFKLDFSGVDLKNARFVGSSFVGSSFVGSSFVGSRFDGSSFDDSSFVGSRFVDSRFVGSRFVDSRFVGSRFDGSSFVDSRFDGSSFVDSRFDGNIFVGNRFVDSIFVDSEMPPEYLTQVRDDFWAVLSAQPAEIDGLRLALVEGRVNGSQYEGACACLVGTIANVARCKHDSLPRLKPNPNRLSEGFFLRIREGDTPEKSVYAKLVVGWLDEWVENVRGAFATTSA